MRTTAFMTFGLLALTALSACARPTHPWDQGADAEAPSPPQPVLTGLPASLRGPDPGGSAAPSAVDPDLPTPPVRVGGPWVRCYGGFHPSGDPVKDVTRLSILCGPENGMRRLSQAPIQGSVAEKGPTVTATFETHRGECYRVFAVAEPTVQDLDVVIRTSRGTRIAADDGEDSWPIVQPDRPFCPLEDDHYSIEIAAKRGSGKFAAEVWVLRTPTKRLEIPMP